MFTTILKIWEGSGYTLGDTRGPLEGFPVISSHTFRHGFPIPILGQELEDMGSHPIPLHHHQVATPVQCVICIVDIHKYLIQDLLPHAHNIMEGFGLQGVRTSSSL